MTPDQLRQIVPSMPIDLAAEAAAAINAAAARFDIDTTVRQAHFTAQAVHESRGFMSMTENLDYAVQALLAIWPKHFTPELAGMYGRIDGVKAANQQMIANVAYANRMGNGSIESGDGWRFRGRGPGQLTGRDEYTRCGQALGIDLAAMPDQVALPRLGCAAFGWFWKIHGLNELADAGAVDRISGIVNGGDLGLQARRDLTEHCLEVLS